MLPGGSAMSFSLLIKIAALASACCMGIGAARAENRIALVIGNSNYLSVSALPNPGKDARAMTKFLSSAGFQVLEASDLKQREMLRTIGNFAGLLAEKGPDTVALVFYAGHGLQIDGENYLVPVDAMIQREADVPLQSMRLADLMNALSSVSVKARIVILDACRNNPFSDINKTTGRGLAIVDAPSGSLISYSTAPGTEALDGDGANSPYTAALLRVARERDLPIEQALKRVRLAVNESTGKQQVPWESSSLTSEFSFFPRDLGSTGTKAASAPASNAATGARMRSVEAWQKELKTQSPREAYETVIREDTVEAYEAYLLVYPSDPLTAVVRRIVERRREMLAWHEAVSANTAGSYQGFLTAHASSDYAPTARRLVERPRQRRGVAAQTSNAINAPVASSPIVTAPVVVPVYDPQPVRFPVRHKWHPPHHNKPVGSAWHGKGAKFGKSMQLTKRVGSIRPASRYVPRNAMVNRRMTLNRRITANRGTFMGRGTMMGRGMMGRGMMGGGMMGRGMMGRGMSMGFRPSFGGGGFMGGGRRFF
jgi:uncharacterized caspase-like protein